MKRTKELVQLFKKHLSKPTKVVGLVLLVFTVLSCFEISESIPGFTWFIFLILIFFSVQLTLELKGWLSEQSAEFFRKRNFFISLGFLVINFTIIFLGFYLSSDEIIYQTKLLLLLVDIVLSSGLVLMLVLFVPLVFSTIYILGGPPKISQVKQRISKRRLILIPIYSILGLVGVFVAVLLMGWGLYTSQEFVSGIYWDKYFCGPSKIEKATSGVVRIETESGSGTGFWIDEDLIITNSHVVLFDNEINIIAPGATYYSADVVQTDTIKDIAILRIAKTTDYEIPKILKWRKRWPVLAEDVFILGYPKGTKDISVSRGIVSSLTSDEFDSTRYIQTDAAINEGNSGGPLVDICGRILGISTSTLYDAENIGYAVDGSRVKDQVDEMILASKEITSEEVKHGQTGGEAEIVIKYYLTLSRGNFEDAYDYYSDDLKNQVLFKGWKEGYKNTFAIRFKSAKKISPGTVEVLFRTVDLPEKENEDYTVKEFKGTWTLVKINGLWKLNQPSIREVQLTEEDTYD